MNPRISAALLFMLLSRSVLLAVSPLVTDDADTVEPGKVQLNCDFFVVRTASTSVYSVSPNPVLGLLPGLEFGAIFGYQWRDSSGPNLATSDASGVTDLTLAPKFRLWQGLDEKVKFSARMDLKLPTAPGSRGLGTGNPDVGLVGIATYKLGKTSFDSNIGYYSVNIARPKFDDDRWFIGQTVRYELNKEWNVITETYGLLPNTGAGGSANWYFSGGLQSSVRENMVVTALIGSAAGHKSPDVTGTFEVTLTF